MKSPLSENPFAIREPEFLETGNQNFVQNVLAFVCEYCPEMIESTSKVVRLNGRFSTIVKSNELTVAADTLPRAVGLVCRIEKNERDH